MKKHKKFDTSEDELRTEALSEEELSMLKASIESADIDRSKLPPHDTSDKANFFRLIRSNLVFSIIAIIVAIALIVGAIGGSALLVIKYLNYHRDFSIVIGDNEPYAKPYKETVINGIIYIDLREIADYTSMITSGSKSRIQITSDNGTYLLFENESEYVYINGGCTRIAAERMSDGKKVSAVAYVDKDSCLIPLSFLSKVVSEDSIIVGYHEKSQTIYVKPKYIVYDNILENKVMKDVLFITDNFKVTIPESERPVYQYTYAIDVSNYLESITTENLLLANKSNPLGKNYEPGNLVALECPTTRSGLKLQNDAAVALYAMMLEMEAAGITETYVTSAYRDYAYQYKTYWGYVEKEKIKDGYITQEEAERRASEYSARPGESEHQTGLCFDFITESMAGNLNVAFEKTEAFAWLKTNAYKYGFIIRYPKDKVDITGYQYEPWHYRFVGRQAASEIYFSGVCLEEYLENAN